MEDKISLVSIDKIIGKSNENIIIEKISSKLFFSKMAEKGYNKKILNLLFGNKNSTTEELIKFNSSLKCVKELLGINFYEIILYFEDMHIKYKKVCNFIDDEVKFAVKQELGVKYGILEKDVTLDDFFKMIWLLKINLLYYANKVRYWVINKELECQNLKSIVDHK